MAAATNNGRNHIYSSYSYVRFGLVALSSRSARGVSAYNGFSAISMKDNNLS